MRSTSGTTASEVKLKVAGVSPSLEDGSPRAGVLPLHAVQPCHPDLATRIGPAFWLYTS
jgi:hypothetical protein